MILRVFALIFLFFNLSFSQVLFSPQKVIKFDEKKADLGEKIFYDTSLNEAKISCENCHNLYLNQSGSSKILNPPTILNVANSAVFTQEIFTLNKRIKQSILASNELNANEKDLITKIKNNGEYAKKFGEIYKGKIDLKTITDALENFLKSLNTQDSKFDKFLKNEANLSENEKIGMEIFVSIGCVICHNGINLGSNNFALDAQKERIKKVPTLRNIAKTAPYFNEINKLEIAILFMARTKLNKTLNHYEVSKITEFLQTLSGDLYEK